MTHGNLLWRDQEVTGTGYHSTTPVDQPDRKDLKLRKALLGNNWRDYATN